ncbi:MAG: hypothetical protein ACRC6T_05885 [Sarcina sp.]
MNKKDNEQNKNLPAIISYTLKDLVFEKPVMPKGTSKNTIKAIENSYNQCCFLDKRGVIWFDAQRLDGILRTTKGAARYMLSDIPDNLKLFVATKTYVRGYEVGKLIDIRIQATGTKSKKEYLKYSEGLYKAIRDCNTSFFIRASAELELKMSRKGLKNKRVKKYKTKLDELTGEKLRMGSEFSHIRAYVLFTEYADDIENGLIVNKDTHAEITAKNINDEDELLALCKENKWKTDWYERFKRYIDN